MSLVGAPEDKPARMAYAEMSGVAGPYERQRR